MTEAFFPVSDFVVLEHSTALANEQQASHLAMMKDERLLTMEYHLRASPTLIMPFNELY